MQALAVALASLVAGLGGVGAGGTWLPITVWPRETGASAAWTLLATRSRGAFREAARACRELAAMKAPFAPIPPNTACSQVYGGPRAALICSSYAAAGSGRASPVGTAARSSAGASRGALPGRDVARARRRAGAVDRGVRRRGRIRRGWGRRPARDDARRPHHRRGQGQWTLTCDPTGGDHPDPAAACAALAAHADALEPVAETACTELYGGPQEAGRLGLIDGEIYSSTFTRRNGNEIAR